MRLRQPDNKGNGRSHSLMLSKIRNRLTFANVAMTLALVFGMSGGAYAAGRYVITSTKQISPKVLKSLQGRGPAGAAGAQGSQGPQGAQGPAGPVGAAGAKGETGTAGAPGATGKEGPKGPEGSPWTAGGTLPSGRTETGYSNAVFPAVKPPRLLVAISFPIPLKEALSNTQVHYASTAPGSGGAACPGTAEKPEAEPGNLCVYEIEQGGALEPMIVPSFEAYLRAVETGKLSSLPGTGTSGAALFYPPEETAGVIDEEEERIIEVAWAVTAP
jgi:Collagen triple helix repeat (20 copies)